LTLHLNTLLEVFDSYFNIIAEVFCLISHRPFIILSPYSVITGLMVCWSLVNILSLYFLVSILKVLRILPLYLHNTQSVVLCPAPSAREVESDQNMKPTTQRLGFICMHVCKHIPSKVLKNNYLRLFQKIKIK